jgi:hypothetical protein
MNAGRLSTHVHIDHNVSNVLECLNLLAWWFCLVRLKKIMCTTMTSWDGLILSGLCHYNIDYLFCGNFMSITIVRVRFQEKKMYSCQDFVWRDNKVDWRRTVRRKRDWGEQYGEEKLAARQEEEIGDLRKKLKEEKKRLEYVLHDLFKTSDADANKDKMKMRQIYEEWEMYSLLSTCAKKWILVVIVFKLLCEISLYLTF